MAERKFLDFLDRIDGGGMGQSGDTFEGGGLLSMLGNLLASPYGSKDPERRARRDAFYGGEPMAATGFNPTPVRTAGEITTGGGLQYSGRGNVGMPTRPTGPSINPANAYGAVGMTFQDFVAGLGPLAQTASPEDLMTAYRQHMMGY